MMSRMARALTLISAKLRQLPGSRPDVKLLLIFLALASLALLFGTVASEVAEGDTLALDRAVLRAFRSPDGSPAGPNWLQTMMLNVTALGSVSVLTLVTALVIGYLLTARKGGLAIFVLASTSGGAIVGTLLKELFARPRPAIVPHLVSVDSLSFPSGHALNSAVIYLTLGALLARSQGQLSIRAYAISAAIVLVLLIGLSRVYLGVHYPTDVVAGWCAGAIWATACSAVARALQKRHTLEGPDEASPR